MTTQERDVLNIFGGFECYQRTCAREIHEALMNLSLRDREYFDGLLVKNVQEVKQDLPGGLKDLLDRTDEFGTQRFLRSSTLRFLYVRLGISPLATRVKLSDEDGMYWSKQARGKKIIAVGQESVLGVFLFPQVEEASDKVISKRREAA